MPGEEQAVVVYLDTKSLPQVVCDENDLATLAEQLEAAVEKADVGRYEGSKVAEGHATLIMYGPDAEAIYAAVEAVLRAYPLCQGARVVIRRGGLEAESREVHLKP